MVPIRSASAALCGLLTFAAANTRSAISRAVNGTVPRLNHGLGVRRFTASRPLHQSPSCFFCGRNVLYNEATYRFLRASEVVEHISKCQVFRMHVASDRVVH